MQETPLPEIFDMRDEPAAAGAPAIQPPATSTALATVDLLAVAISRFGQWRAGAAALVERYREVVFDLSTTAGYAELTKAIAEVRAPRYAAQNVAKASKTELVGISRAIGTEEAAVTTFLSDTETRLVALRDSHDEKVKADKAEAARIDAERIAGHQAKIATIRSFLGRCLGLPAVRIALGIEQLHGQVYGEDWHEFRVPAANAQCETLEAMRKMYAQTVEREAEDARLEADRKAEAARLDAQRTDQARVDAEQADAARQLAEQQAELARQHKAITDNMLRVTGLQGRIAEIRAAATGHERSTAADLSEAITAVTALDVSEGQFQEFSSLANMAKAFTLSMLQDAHSDAERLACTNLVLPTPPEQLFGDSDQMDMLPTVARASLPTPPEPETLSKMMQPQQEIDAISDALRVMGLTWRQINFAVSLIRNAVAVDRERICNALPGGKSVDPQWVSDMVRCVA